MTPRLDADDVHGALRANVAALLDAYGWRYHREGARLKSPSCPARADHSRPDAFSISSRDGRWQCFPCGTGGDALDFIAAMERLDVARDFEAVLARGAAIVGIEPSLVGDVVARRDARERSRLESEARDRAARAARDQAAVGIATSYWASLALEHDRGLAYLAGRELADAAPLVRFDLRCAGSPAVALYSSLGEVRNVVRRRLPELGEPKTPGLSRCPTAGTLLGTIAQIAPGQPTVVTEGVADTLTAALAWPRAVVLGAHGAGNLPAVVGVAARRCMDVGTGLAIVPHNDEAGERAAKAALELAIRAGLRSRNGSLKVIRHNEKDLNDAWRRGWRP